MNDLLGDVEAHEGRRVYEREFGSAAEQVQAIKAYFQGEVWDLEYPTKSYVVALVYATLLHRHFGENVIEALDDPDLLFGNDRWFRPYSQSKDVYDQALTELKPILDLISEGTVERIPSQIQATARYFDEEFLIGKPF